MHQQMREQFCPSLLRSRLTLTKQLHSVSGEHRGMTQTPNGSQSAELHLMPLSGINTMKSSGGSDASTWCSLRNASLARQKKTVIKKRIKGVDQM